MALCAISFSACSDGGLNPKTTKIAGPLGEFFEIVDHEYIMLDGKYVQNLNVEFKRIKEGGPTPNLNGTPSFTAEVLDENGNTIDKVCSSDFANDDHLEDVFSLNVDDISSYPFYFENTKVKDKDIEYFKISSKWDPEVQSDKKNFDVIKVKPKSTKISGPLGEYFEVVDRTYKLREEEFEECNISVEITRIKKGGPTIDEEGDLMRISLLDLDGDEVANVGNYKSRLDDVFALNVGESTLVTFWTFFSTNPNIKDASTFKLSSTGDGINPKTVDSNTKSESNTTSKEESSTKASGIEVILPSPLRGKVEVTHVSKAYTTEYGSAAIDVNFKLLQTVNVTPDMHGSPGGQVWIVGEVQDAGGLTIKDLMPFYNEWRTKDSYGREFKAFLQSEPGETINMTFTGSDAENSSESVSDLCEKVAKFKLKFSK